MSTYNRLGRIATPTGIVGMLAHTIDMMKLDNIISDRPAATPLQHLDAMYDLVNRKWFSGKYLETNPEKSAATVDESENDEYYEHVCLIGSITAAWEINLWNYSSARSVVALLLEVLYPNQVWKFGDDANMQRLTDWNDEPGRTKEQVLELIDKARNLYKQLQSEGKDILVIFDQRIDLEKEQEGATEQTTH